MDVYASIKDFCVKKFNFSNGNIVLFRGTKTNFLCPSIRAGAITNSDELEVTEDAIHSEFSATYQDSIDEKDEVLKDWQLRIMGREHGLRNRLLDWSFVFYNSLDFATFTWEGEKLQDEFVYLWVLSIEPAFKTELDQLRNLPFSKISEPFVFNGINVYNSFQSRRQFIQGGFFLVEQTDLITTNIDEQPFFDERLVKIKIPVVSIPTIRADLAKTEGIDLSKSLMIENNEVDEFCYNLNKKYLSK